MRAQDWDSLLWSLKRQHCILLLGPDTAASDESVSPASLRQQLARSLTGELDDGQPPEDALFSAARRYRAKYSTMDLQRQVEAFFDQHQTDESPVLRDLASLPFYFVITSCQDSLLRTAFAARGKDVRVQHYNYRGPRPDNIDMGSVERPLIYHLHGVPSVPESLVLTDDDLLDSLVKIVKGDPGLPASIGAELGKSKSLLFVGFGIKQWHLRVLLHELRAAAATNDSRSFAFEGIDGAAASDPTDTVVFYHRYKIEVFNTVIPSFVTELRERYERSGAAAPALQPAPIGRPPRVFLCHATEDKPVVQRVSEALRGAGCDPWIDKDTDTERSGLHMGDSWDRRIREEVGASDYVLVFVSQALARKQIGYVNREIALALERQKEFRYPNRFVIPVKIEPCDMPPDLAGLQALERFDPNALEPLSREILRDFQRRVARQ